MFLRLPFQFSTHVQQTVLILNTILLIAALVVAELVFADMSKRKKTHLKYFYPVIAVMAGILVFAVYKQVKAA